MLAEPEEVRAYLVAAARAGTALTYSELLERLGYAFSRPKMRQLCVILGRIDDEGALRGEPELAVLVVRQADGLPGQGWWVAGGGRSRGYKGLGKGRRRRVSSPPCRRKPSPSGSPIMAQAVPKLRINHVSSPIAFDFAA